MALKGKGGRRSSKAAQGNNNTKSRSRSRSRSRSIGGRRSSKAAQGNNSTNNNKKEISKSLSNDTGNGLGYIGDAIDTTVSTGGPKRSLREKYASTIPNTFGETEYGLPAAGKNFLNKFLGGPQLNSVIDIGDAGLRSLLNTAYGTAGLIGDATGNEQLAKTLAAMVESGGGTFGMGRTPNFSNTVLKDKSFKGGDFQTVYRGTGFPRSSVNASNIESGAYFSSYPHVAQRYAKYVDPTSRGIKSGITRTEGFPIIRSQKVTPNTYPNDFLSASISKLDDTRLLSPIDIGQTFSAFKADPTRVFNNLANPQNYGPLANAGISSLANVGSSITPSLSNVGGITSLSPLYYRNN